MQWLAHPPTAGSRHSAIAIPGAAVVGDALVEPVADLPPSRLFVLALLVSVLGDARL